MRDVIGRAARGIGVLAVIGSGFWGGGAAQADDFTIGGAFNDLNDVVLIEFSHPGGPFRAFTSQWNGGGPPDGPLLPAADPALDGFDAQLQLFDGIGAGALFVEAGDDDCAEFSTNPATIVAECSQTIGSTTFTGGARDSLIDFATLAAGDYTLGLTNFNNDPFEPTLGDGYNDDGDDGFSGFTGFTGPQFRVHLQGIDQILSVDAPNPVSISGPFNSDMTM